MTTKKQLTEQIRRILAGGNIRSSEQVTAGEVAAAIGQVAARILRAESVNITMPFGGNIPPSCIIATYSNNEVVAINDDYSKVELPVQPIMLPMNIGIFRVYKTSCYNCDIIPVEPGQLSLVSNIKHNQTSSLFSDELIAYEPRGSHIVINRSKADIDDTIDIQLLVSDVSALGEYDILPLSADQESAIIVEVLKIFGMYQPHDNANDNLDKP
jgi:hypothetical protein